MSSLQSLSSTLRPADLLDVAVVSVFVYAVISWVRRARSRFVLLGLSTLVGLYFAARLLTLYLTLFLFQVGLTVALITLVVIFQEDIRRAFERLATTRLLHEGRARGGESGFVDTVVTAVKELAERKIGALIVFKGTEPLERHITGGVPLDGRISPPLLYSIFDTGSAGHDGAAIIENGIVTTFAAHLPLSTREDSDAIRGTRHTAAVGLSERSDALVVVVSEERSTISIAQGGTLQVIASLTDLRHRLNEFQQTVTPQDRTRWYQRMFTRNLGTKAASIAIACTAWLVIHGQQSEVSARTYTVPIVYKNLPAGLWLDEPPSNDATVTLSGSNQALKQLDADSLLVSLDMANVEPGQQQLPITENQLNHPAELEVQRITPASVELAVFEVAVVEVPVKPRLVGLLPSGVKLVDVANVPAMIKLEVKHRDRRRCTVIATTAIDLAGLTETQRFDRELVIPQFARLAPGEPATVQVTVNLATTRQRADSP